MDLYGSLVANEGSGGGGGTVDVPIKSISVNGSGVAPVNKNVNIDVPTKTSDLTNDSNFASTDDIPTKTSDLTNDSNFASTSDIPTKVSQLTNDSKFVTDNELTSKGYASTSDIPTKVSQLTNDSKFVTESDLTAKNYADKTYVGEQIAQSEHLKRKFVDVLPEPSEADEHTIYMLKVDSVQGSDKYKEYMLIEGVVQCVGDTSVDLTDYAKKTDIPTELPANGGNSDTVNNHTVKSDVPENAVFTDTIYSDATQIEHGLMSVDDKKKLDGLTKYTPDGTTITADEDGTLHGAAKVTVDDALSETSTNPVQNKVILRNLINIKKVTTVNLINPVLQTVTRNGITCTNNGDGTYTFNGTATDGVFFDINKNIPITKGTKYKVVCFKDEDYIPDKITSSVRRVDIANAYIFNNGPFVSDTENCWLWVRIEKGVTVSNLVAKPILTTNLYATYDDFVPYTGDGGSLNWDVAELNDRKADKSETTVNLLNPTLKTSTSNGITCTDNGDGTYTLNGTSTDMVTFIVQSTEELSKKHINEDLWLVGCPKNGSMNTYKLQFWSASNKVAFDFGSGAKFRIENSEYGNIAIRIETGVTVNNLVFKPMLTTNLSATYDDFVPYTGDGKTLASDVSEIKKDLGNLTFSASGTTLTITDGTNTWTLEANN